MAGITEAIIHIRNEQLAYLTRRCKHCDQLVTLADAISQECPKAGDEGLHELKAQYFTAPCEMPHGCWNVIDGYDTNLATVDDALLLVCDPCFEKLQEAQLQARYE